MASWLDKRRVYNRIVDNDLTHKARWPRAHGETIVLRILPTSRPCYCFKIPRNRALAIRPTELNWSSWVPKVGTKNMSNLTSGESLITNPWSALSERPPYCLEIDKPGLADGATPAFAATALQFGVLPEPYIGRPDADIVLLNLNPGFLPGDDEDRNHNPVVTEMLRKNYLHMFGPFPFYYLHPEFAGSGGYRWWAWNETSKHRRAGILWPLIEISSPEVVAYNVFCAEYFPYASIEGGVARSVRAASSEYTFELVRRALAREALVIILRSARQWEDAVPALCSYSHRFSVNNKRYPIISSRNCPEGFHRAATLLRHRADTR